MSLSHDLFPQALPRSNKFQRLFQAHDNLGDVINEILDTHTDKLQVREGEERDLSLLVVAFLGKGMKTSRAVTRLCLLGTCHRSRSSTCMEADWTEIESN